MNNFIRKYSKGFTLLELIIAGTISLIGILMIYNAFIISARFFTARQEVVEMQQNARASIEFLTSQLRGVSSISNINCTENESSVTFFSIDEIGTPTSSTYTTLSDSTKSWVTDDWQKEIVVIIDGNSAGQVRAIISNTDTQLSVFPEWSELPDSTSLYQIRRIKSFSRDTANNELIYTMRGNNTTFAFDITSLTIQGYNEEDYCDCNSANIKMLEINLTARTSTPDQQNNNEYEYYSVKTSLVL